jgi:hypothetical protein
MKNLIIITMLAAVSLSFWNFNAVTPKLPIVLTTQFPGIYQDSGLAGLRLKRVAAGEDINKNGILEESEKMKKLEPGAYDNIHFIDRRIIRIYGMGMDFYGLYTFNKRGNKYFIEITPDTTRREPLSNSAHKFEYLYWLQDTLVVVPPIYTFMLCQYKKQK